MPEKMVKEKLLKFQLKQYLFKIKHNSYFKNSCDFASVNSCSTSSGCNGRPFNKIAIARIADSSNELKNHIIIKKQF